MFEYVKESFAELVALTDRSVTVKHRSDARALQEELRETHGVRAAIEETSDGRYRVSRQGDLP